jgi:hypothetical protein
MWSLARQVRRITSALLNPHRCEISFWPRVLSSRWRRAASSLNDSTNFAGVVPVSCTNMRAKWRGLMAARRASSACRAALPSSSFAAPRLWSDARERRQRVRPGVYSDREAGTGLYERRCRAKPRVDLAHEAFGDGARCNMSSETAVIEVQKGKRIPVLGVWGRRRLVPRHEQPWYAVWSSLVVDRFLLSVPHGERTQALEHLAERRRDGPSQKEPLGLLSIRFEFVDAIAITRFPVLAAELVRDVQQLRPREPGTLGMILARFAKP